MKQLGKIKLSELGQFEKLDTSQLSQVKGGEDISLFSYGCFSFVCASVRSGAASACSTAYCVCSMGG